MALFGVQKFSVDFPSHQVLDERILYGSHLHIVLGGNANLLLLLVEDDLRFRLPKIVTRQNRFLGNINRVVDLLKIDLTDYIKGRHGSVFLRHSQNFYSRPFPPVRLSADLVLLVFLFVLTGNLASNPLKTKSKISLLVIIPTKFLFLTTGREPIRWRRKRPTAFLSDVSG